MRWSGLTVSRRAFPSHSARPRRRGQARFYVGRRGERSEVYVVTLRDVERLRTPGPCSDAAFEWGGHAERGGAKLAFAILSDMTGRQPPDPVCAQFDDEVVALLPDPGFVLGCDDIALWLAAARRDPGTWRRAAVPGGRRRRAGALALLGALVARRAGARPVR
jgi:hypothetical protein